MVYLIDHILDRMDRQMTTGAMQLLRGPLRDYIFFIQLKRAKVARSDLGGALLL